MAESKTSKGLVTGLVLGATVGAGLTFLFGTKKGQELQKGLRKRYPDLFEKLDDVVIDVKDSVTDGVDSVKEKGEDIKSTITKKLGFLAKKTGKKA